MESVLNNFLSTPLYYVGLPVSALAVLSLLVFIRGFVAGAGYVFGDNGHIEHQDHAEARVTWGTLLLAFIFIFWECLRFIASWFGVGTYSVPTGTIMLTIAAIWVLSMMMNKGGGGGH